MKLINLNTQVLDKGTGYFYVYFPGHEMDNASGKVYIHRYIASIKYGRILKSNEHVHHLDENKLNNDASNLQVMSSTEHAKLHQTLKGHVELNKICSYCALEFITYDEEQKYCSHECSSSSRKQFEITPEKLKELIWKYPTTTVAKMCGVSDKAIEKRCKKYNIDKPPRGYWAKQNNKAP